MVFVILVGEAARGSRRWIDLGFFRFQPSEFGKLLFILFLAAFLADRAKKLDEWRTTAATLGLGLDPDPARLPPARHRNRARLLRADPGRAVHRRDALDAPGGDRVLAAALVVTAVLWFLPAGGIHILKPYQQARLTSFLDPGNDPSGTSYNLTSRRSLSGRAA